VSNICKLSREIHVNYATYSVSPYNFDFTHSSDQNYRHSLGLTTLGQSSFIVVYSGNARCAIEWSALYAYVLVALPLPPLGMVLSQLIASVLSCTSTIKAFRRNSKTEAFAYDLSLVALSIRCAFDSSYSSILLLQHWCSSGYLVDTIHVAGGLAESVYCALLTDLRTVEIC
jgi:hypothetical protein